ncbi:MAG TPA: hypothetical protein VM686_41800 [Polyangiaceae bacterium]|nr:hypothetical protein [Polyangiaceae bacterium]
MKFSKVWLVAALGLFALGCESGGVGDPCTPEDEYTQGFANFSDEEVNVESRSFQCETRICLVNHFQGRVSCPYGQSETDLTLPGEDPARCRIPGTDGIPDEGTPPGENYETINTPVLPQLHDRQAEKAVYCSCRCDGPDEGARYCECPSGYKCTELVRELGLSGAQLAGSYCVRNGTEYNPTRRPVGNCDRLTDPPNCGNDGVNP